MCCGGGMECFRKKTMRKRAGTKREDRPTPVGFAKKPCSVFLFGLKSIQQQSVCDRWGDLNCL